MRACVMGRRDGNGPTFAGEVEVSGRVVGETLKPSLDKHHQPAAINVVVSVRVRQVVADAEAHEEWLLHKNQRG